MRDRSHPAPRSLPLRGALAATVVATVSSCQRRDPPREKNSWRRRVTYVVYTERVTSASRADLDGFWRWVKARDAWFYKERPMVKRVRRYATAGGGIST